MNALEVIHIVGATGICKAILTAVLQRSSPLSCTDAEQVRTPPDLNLSASSSPAAMAMDLLVPAPMPDICVRLWKNCPRPASHVVPWLTDRLHRDRTALLLPSSVRSSGSPPIRLRRQRLLLPSSRQRLPLPSSMRSSGSPPFVSDFGKLPKYDRSPPSRRDGNTHAVP